MPAHVTILAPIEVDAAAMPAVVGHLASVAATVRPFRLVLRGVGTFRPTSRVVFVAVGEGGVQCERLEKQVRSGDMAVETRYPYHPHVTIAHDVPDAVLDAALADLEDFAAEYDVDSMGLYENVDGAWRLIEEFDFTG
ncbi:MAG: 2'-5' RNA ligase family protein [Actinobacteria bacterium]|nr:2'-5' RNA ligase family protein [Actinomycetota bacterium]